MVFGPSNVGGTFLDLDGIGTPHYSVKPKVKHIEDLAQEIKSLVTVAKERLVQLRMVNNEKSNKNRTDKAFKVNDYVFTVDRSIIPGNPRVLKTKLSPSPYIVVRPLWSTTLVKRLSDGYTTLYSNTDLKRYDGASPLFKDLPAEINRVLLHKFDNLLNEDLTTIAKIDPLTVPLGIELYQESDTEPEKEDEVEKMDDPWLNFQPQGGIQVTDEFEKEEESQPLDSGPQQADGASDENKPQELNEFVGLQGHVQDEILDEAELARDLQELANENSAQGSTLLRTQESSSSESDDDEGPSTQTRFSRRLRNKAKNVTFAQ